MHGNSQLACDVSRRLATLAVAQRVIAAPGFDINQLPTLVRDWALALSAADLSLVEVRDGDHLVNLSVTGGYELQIGPRRAVAGTIAGACMQSGEPVFWSDGDTDRLSVLGTELGLRSIVAVPMPAESHRDALGVLTLGSYGSHAFGDEDVLALQILAGMAGAALADASVAEVLSTTEVRYRTLIEHLPETAVMVYDSELRLLVATGPGAKLWRYAERNVLPGLLLDEIVSAEELALLEPFYRSVLVEAGTLEYHSEPTGLDFHFSGAPMRGPDGEVDQMLVTVTDVTQRKADDERLAAAEQRFRTAFDSAPVGMAQMSLAGDFQEVNRALGDMTGFSIHELLHKGMTALTHPDDLEQGVVARAAMLAGDSNGHVLEQRLIHADGHVIWVSLSTNVVHDSFQRPLYLLSHFLDITGRKQFDEQLRFAADHDPLTGLLNRRSFEAALGRHVATVARYGPAGALLVLDLDHFKQINDTLGHHAGDELIIALADVLRRRLRSTDVIARLGGDEFAVILPFATCAQAEGVVADVLKTVREEVTVLAGRYPRTVTTSIGIAMFDEVDLTGPEVLINADLAMYDAKDAGRNCYAVHIPHNAEQPTTRARLAWVDRIRHALEHDRFTLFAQPIMDLRTRTITRHELLLRMLDDNDDVICPSTFLGVAEKFGLIGRIDRWVVDRAITTLAAHPDLDLSFEVNLSGVSIGDPELLAFIEQRLGAAPTVDPARLTFEITETAAVANIGRARAFADRLTALGCSFALDDFGAGYGSFYYLKYLPFDDLKIDGEFITHCLTSVTDRLVIDAVIGVAQGLGKRTIAEYVGNEATLEFLADHGVDFGQGYHIGLPTSLDETIERIQAEHPRQRVAALLELGGAQATSRGEDGVFDLCGVVAAGEAVARTVAVDRCNDLA